MLLWAFSKNFLNIRSRVHNFEPSEFDSYARSRHNFYKKFLKNIFSKRRKKCFFILRKYQKMSLFCEQSHQSDQGFKFALRVSFLAKKAKGKRKRFAKNICVFDFASLFDVRIPRIAKKFRRILKINAPIFFIKKIFKTVFRHFFDK